MDAENSSVNYSVHTVSWRIVFYPRSLAHFWINKYECSQGKDVVRNFRRIKITPKKDEVTSKWFDSPVAESEVFFHIVLNLKLDSTTPLPSDAEVVTSQKLSS